MRHLPHLSHLFRLFSGAASAMAGSTVATMVTASGSARVPTAETGTASQGGGSHEADATTGDSLNGTRANGAGSAAVFLAAGAGRTPQPVPPGSTARSAPRIRPAPPVRWILPPPPPDRPERRCGTTSSSSTPLHGRASAGVTAPPLCPLDKECRLGLNTMDPQYADEKDDSAREEPARRAEARGTAARPALTPDTPIRAPTAPSPVPGMRTTGTHDRSSSPACNSGLRANEGSCGSPLASPRPRPPHHGRDRREHLPPPDPPTGSCRGSTAGDSSPGRTWNTWDRVPRPRP